MFLPVCGCEWLGVGKVKCWYLRACFILVFFLVFLLCPGRCVQFAVFILLLSIVRGVSVWCGCATASSYSLYTFSNESRGISYVVVLSVL